MPVQTDPTTVLQRVLLLERQQGFQDRAAVGGLANFARTQRQRAQGSDVGALDAAVQILAAYGEADRRQREAAVADALHAVLTRTGPSEPASAARPIGVSPRLPHEPSASSSQESPSDRRVTAAPPTAGGRSRPTPVTRGKSAAPVRRAALSVVRAPADLDKPITTIKGIGKANERPLATIGITVVRDLIYYFPRAHYDYTDTRSISRMRLGEKTTLVGTIENVRNNRTSRGVVITTATISDDTGTVGVRWFNQPYLQRRLPIGARIAITGEPDVFNGFITFQPRDYEIIESDQLTHAGRLVPVYPLTKGLYQRSLRTLIRRVLDEYLPALEDHLGDDLREELRLPVLSEAVRGYHFPEDEEEKEWSQQRLAFDELLSIQLGLLMRKQEWQRPAPGVAIEVDPAVLSDFFESLPFRLTDAQRRVIDRIVLDLQQPFPMSRLLQGDVGSGKTVVAAAALLATVRAGKQGVLMAPTEILAEQHHRTLSALLAPFDVGCELLLGSTPKARRRQINEATRSGATQVLVGTHALIQEGVELADLGLAITDEQHRFGVEQRALLRQKGLQPHILAMTATPIPRTLAMTIYGDLDVSVIDEMPPGRLPVVTTWSRTPREAYGVVRDEVRKGRQAFVICPVIEESMESDMRSVIAEHRELQEVIFPDLRVGLLHGKMKPKEKDATLEAFRAGEYHILVATSVVEVGIDVPNATVMVIRDAHRFGLAQLHQFRGRVGRGGDQAFCVLLSDARGDNAVERLEALTATEDGFAVAEEDLRLRGPGEFWGTRQSGLPELRIATLGDIATIDLAQRAAREILDRDPNLTAPENSLLKREVVRFWHDAADLS